MKSQNQARGNAARRRQAETGEPYATALQAVRNDRLRRADELAEPDANEAGAFPPSTFHDLEVPQALPELVRYHSDRIGKYLYAALNEGRWPEDFAEWQRMTLYKLTDALEHLHLMIGTVGAYLRDTGVSQASLCRYFQVSEYRQVEAFFTPHVEDHLAGLTGRAEPNDSVVWHSVGSDIASKTGWSDQDRLDAFETALHALYANYPDDPRAFDHLPAALRERIVALAPHARRLPQGDGQPPDQA